MPYNESVPDTTLPIPVATFNIRNNLAVFDWFNHWWFRRSSVRTAIEATGADIIGLQEVRPLQLRYLRKRLSEPTDSSRSTSRVRAASPLTQYRFLSAGRNDGQKRGEHCPILVNPIRFDIPNWRVRWFSETPDIPGTKYAGSPQIRICTMAELVDRATGYHFGVMNVHLQPVPVSYRERSIQQMATWIEESSLPWVIMGDFNGPIDEPPLQPLWNARYSDALAAIPPRGTDCASFHCFQGWRDGLRIDHILVPEQWRAEHATIHFDRPKGKLPSDHWPVSVTLTPNT